MSQTRKRKKSSQKKVESPKLHDRVRRKLESRRGTHIVLLTIAVLALIVSILVFDTKLSLSGDNTEFIVLARSIASGQGMQNINSPTPRPTTKFPFGFPLFLAAVELLFPQNLIAMKGLVLLFFVGTLLVLYLLLKEHIGIWIALGVALFSIINPHLLDFSHQVMSEIPYLFFSVLALFLIQRCLKNSSILRNYWLIGGTLSLMYAYYVRAIGIALICGVLVYFLINREYKKALFITIAAVVIALPWQLRNSSLGGSSYLKQLILVNPYHRYMGFLDLHSFWTRIKINAQIYFLREIPRALLPTYRGIGDLGGILKVVGILGVGIYGFTLALMRKSLLALYLLFFMGICIIWPQVWSGMRFIIPIIPLFICFGLSGLLNLAKRIEPYIHRLSTVTVVSVSLLVFFASNVHSTVNLGHRSKGDYPPNWRNYFKCGQWLKRNTPEDTIVSCRKGYWMYVVSNRKTVGYRHTKDAETVIRGIEESKADFVIVEQLGFGSTPRYLVPAINKFPDRFQVAFFLDRPPTYVLRFIKSR